MGIQSGSRDGKGGGLSATIAFRAVVIVRPVRRPQLLRRALVANDAGVVNEVLIAWPTGELMRCSKCGSDNPADKKFCGDCGTPLANRCPKCGAENPPGKRFCGDCGIALTDKRASAHLRASPLSAP